MFTHAVQTTRNNTGGWLINGGKMWISGMHRATHCLVFARTHGQPGDAIGITAFFVPKDTPGESYSHNTCHSLYPMHDLGRGVQRELAKTTSELLLNTRVFSLNALEPRC
jgi:alkylation response protein AidB-like acyl-CoA dehydrogenase